VSFCFRLYKCPNNAKKIIPNNVFDVISKHCISLDIKLHEQDIVYCKHCDNVVTDGFYRFVCHLTGMENVDACEGVGDEVREEMLEIHTNLQEIHEEGCVGSSRDGFKRKRVGSEASVVHSKNEKSSREETCQAIARFFYNNAIPFAAAKSVIDVTTQITIN